MHSKEQTLELLALEQFLAILSWEPQGQPPGQWRGGGSCTGGTGHFLGRDGTFTTSTRLPMHHQLQPFEPQFKCGSWEQHCSKPMLPQAFIPCCPSRDAPGLHSLEITNLGLLEQLPQPTA